MIAEQTAVTDLGRARTDRLLLLRWQRHGDRAARDELVRRLMPLVRRIARRYRRRDEPIDDLVQVAMMGLVKAIDRFDPERHTAFTAFAIPTMLGELKRHFRDNGWIVHVPRGLQERVLTVEGATREIARRSGQAPSVAEVADATHLPLEDVVEALGASAAHEAISLEDHRFGDGDDGATYADSVGAEDDGFELVEYEAMIAPALRALPPRDRVVLHLRFAEDMTQAEIAERVGISQMHVSRLLRRSLERLRVVAEQAA